MSDPMIYVDLDYLRDRVKEEKERAEAAEAENARLTQGIGMLEDEAESLGREADRLREALREAKAQIGHGASCSCVICAPLRAALAPSTTGGDSA